MTQTPAETGQASGGTSTGPMEPIEVEFGRGLRFAHLVTVNVQRQTDETLRLVEGLNQLLAAKGIVDATESNVI